MADPSTPMPRRGKRLKRIAAAACVSATAFAYAGLSGCATLSYPQSPQFGEDGFQNERKPRALGWRDTGKLWWDFLVGGKPAGTVPTGAIPVQSLSRAQLDAAADGTLYRLGHSTVLLKLGGRFWLTDPVFSERASPVQWAGPKRFHAPPIALDALPPLAAVVLSHDHYDHLDRDTVRALAAKTEVFLTPLGVGDRLVRWGVPRDKVRQLDWWDEVERDGVRFTATPSQHFSGRTLLDRNATLWASWVIRTDELKVFSVAIPATSTVSAPSASAWGRSTSPCWSAAPTTAAGRTYTCCPRRRCRRIAIWAADRWCPSTTAPSTWPSMAGANPWKRCTPCRRTRGSPSPLR